MSLEVTYQDYSSNKTALYILALLPYSNASPCRWYHSWDKGAGILPAAELAIEHINKKSDVLRLYQLHLISGDSGCNVVSKTVVSFVKHVLSATQRVVGIVGPAVRLQALQYPHLLAETPQLWSPFILEQWMLWGTVPVTPIHLES